MAKVVTRRKSLSKYSRQGIKLKDIDHTWGSLTNASELIQTGMPNHIIFHDDPIIIAFHSLGFFILGKEKYNINDRESIEKQCSIILHKFGIYKDGIIAEVFKRKNIEDDYDPIPHFIREIVGFHKMPRAVLSPLEAQVKSNLRELLALIANYESNAIIVNYKNGIRRPEHNSKLVIDFYERCLAERDSIVNYLTNDLEKRAIVKASQDEQLRGIGLMWFESHWDYPYKWWQHRSIEYFDYQKINVCRHRLSEVTVRNIPTFEKLYQTNKSLFYRRLKSFLSPEQIFHELKNFYIPILPKMIERKAAFDELEKLIKVRCWYGFTALALTQVEGVFSDMLHILHPQKSFSSLSTKVLAVRPYYKFEERNFDYFEYHLPFLRNSFLHSGSIKDSDFKLLSYDLLYDLHYLLKVFHEISDPHMELHKILKKNGAEFTFEFKSFNHIFGLLSEVQDRLKKNPKHKELGNTLAEWNSFEKEMLSAELEHCVYAEMYDIDEKISSFFERIKIYTAYDGHELDLAKLDMKYITQQISFIKETHEERLTFFKEDYEKLMTIYTFVKQYQHYLPNCPQAVIDYIDKIQKRYKNAFSKLLILKPVFNLDS